MISLTASLCRYQRASQSIPQSAQLPTGELVYERYYKDPVNRIPKPLFPTPYSQTPILRTPYLSFAELQLITVPAGLHRLRHPHLKNVPRTRHLARHCPCTAHDLCETRHGAVVVQSLLLFTALDNWQTRITHVPKTQLLLHHPHNPQSPKHHKTPRKPIFLYPVSILGLSMVARGETGYMIASLAKTGGVLSQICVGMLVRRVKGLQGGREWGGGRDDLEVWGV